MRTLQNTMMGMVLVAGASGMMGVGQMQRQQQMPPPMQMPQGQQNPGQLPPIDGHMPNDGTGLPPSVLERQTRARNDDRQKQLVADTNKLLELATQLKTDVDKTNRDVLSVDVIKKADEIEKLAKSVKDKMKG